MRGQQNKNPRRQTFMDKNVFHNFKKKLETKKKALEKELTAIARQDPRLKGDYDTKFPDLGITQSPDEGALKVADYERTLPLEHQLEIELASINEALKKIKKGAFGLCEKCGQEINAKRLEVMPEAKLCIKCRRK